MARLFDVYKRDAWGKPIGAPTSVKSVEVARKALEETKARPEKPGRAKKVKKGKSQ